MLIQDNANYTSCSRLDIILHDKFNLLLDLSSCKGIKEIGLDANDGEYNLYLMLPECNQSARIYCADMNTTNPKEYVTLPAGGSNNFALHYKKEEGHRNEEQWTRFEKVLFRSLDTFQISGCCYNTEMV